MLWMPRSSGETVVLTTCPICRVENALPGGGRKSVACPNCHALLSIGQGGDASLVEKTTDCSYCGKQLGESCWFCPHCNRIVKPEIVPEPDAPDQKAFVNAIAPGMTILAADCALQRVLQGMKGNDLTGAIIPKYAESVKDFERLGLASFCLLRAGSDISLGFGITEKLDLIDHVYGLLLFRTYCIVGGPAKKATKAAKDEKFLKKVNSTVEQFVATRCACQNALEPGAVTDTKESRWYVQAPMGNEGFGSWAGKMALTNIATAAVGMMAYRGQGQVLTDATPLLRKVAEVAGVVRTDSEAVSDEQLVEILREDFVKTASL